MVGPKCTQSRRLSSRTGNCGGFASQSKGKYPARKTDVLAKYDFKKTSDSISGTYYVDDVKASYQKLIKLLGKAKNVSSIGGKTRVTWVFKDRDGTIVTLYDYKEKVPLSEVKYWNIGSRGQGDKEASARLKFMIEQYS